MTQLPIKCGQLRTLSPLPTAEAIQIPVSRLGGNKKTVNAAIRQHSISVRLLRLRITCKKTESLARDHIEQQLQTHSI
ncbi:hypothetical protein BKG70_23205 [Mycobacteroides chelonae]|nr:hypothetical protein BKG66_24875 [Mycobacteroides chelonae]OHT84356.1 hypothetical protein BKG70_23205 [Mycobacteroides chelonae]